MKYIAKSRSSLVSVMFVLLLAVAGLAHADSMQEIPVTITSLDLAGNTVTLEGLELASSEYRLAFNLEIILLNGDPGTVNNLRVGDGVTAVVDAGAGVVYKLYVVGSAS
ncbi:MAG: hypothetical protein KJO24_05295 [Gammaproteobacteria bacterium]|nr:hypothetical protein [Gammaproteobacteria bacterium]